MLSRAFLLIASLVLTIGDPQVLVLSPVFAGGAGMDLCPCDEIAAACCPVVDTLACCFEEQEPTTPSKLVASCACGHHQENSLSPGSGPVSTPEEGDAATPMPPGECGEVLDAQDRTNSSYPTPEPPPPRL